MKNKLLLLAVSALAALPTSVLAQTDLSRPVIITRDNTAESWFAPFLTTAPVPARRAIQPRFQRVMPAGPNTMTVENRLNTWVGVGVFSLNVGGTYRYGIIRGVPAGGHATIGIPNGQFELFWIRLDKPSSRFRNARSLSVTGGSAWIRNIATATIGSETGEAAIEETF